ncbi:cupin domain-containing protein [Chitinophaga nivalis]|uniref:Cupin domain-containing protein n=1 Tax=Chitinophaga nivalis TaxID=2991709 RepID=A0ABT3IMZ2_9BACT|nr:cupin domain-containing protein [Chitinophaga nivalis]MCW3464971.1 cupin domain-containing protein [Chitinophaga nivalis]MCW3485337.1 cupin domain-containing protein [Chitinophaga nivalis]
MKLSSFWINHLGLEKFDKGGYLKETYRSSLPIPMMVPFSGERAASTAIYYLLEFGDFSGFHRLLSDEMWHYYAGDTLFIYELLTDGRLKTHRLGKDVLSGEVLQLVIPAGNWFAERVETPDGFSLSGCTIAPGFDYADAVMGNRMELIKEFPQHEQLISSLAY